MFRQLRVHWNDLLAFVVLTALFGGWYARLMPSDVTPAALTWATLILQFFFRKRPDDQEAGK